MTNKENNNWIDETINSLDGIKRAEGKPFLLTRINAKMQKSTITGWDIVLQFISKPLVAAIGILLIVSANILIVSKNYKNTNINNEEQFVSVDEYNTNINALNYNENIEP